MPTRIEAASTTGLVKTTDLAQSSGSSLVSQDGKVVRLGTNSGTSDTINPLYIQSAYLGGTAAANLLDDYEEGTWTATITTASGSVTLRSDRDLCSYTKIGNMVTVRGRVDVDSVSSPSGSAFLSNLPFTSSNSFAELSVRSGGAMMHDSFTGLAAHAGVVYQTAPNSTAVNLYEQNQNGVDALGGHFQAASILVFDFQYPV